MLKTGTILSLAVLALAVLGSAVDRSPPASSPPTSKKSSKTGSATATKPKRGTTKVSAKPGPRSATSATDAAGSRREELRGIWITTDAPRDWEAVMKKLQDHRLNAAFVRIGQGGKVIYSSTILPQDQWAADTGEDELAKAVEAAHRHGIQLHAWKVCFVMQTGKSPKAGRAANEFYERMAGEDRFVRDSKGHPSYWLNPADPRNQDLEVRVAGEVVAKYAVDGYHLDYIRYPDSEPGFDFHFGDVSRREFEKALGRPVPNWPADVSSGPLKLRYEDWERDVITQLVGRIRTEVRTRRPGTLLSAAVWRNIHLYRARLKQDWPRWGREGLVDFLVPMLYETDLDEFRTKTERDLSYVCGRTPFVAGIGIWQIASSETVVAQVEAARDLGADGFVLFSINDPTDKKGAASDRGRVDRHLAALAAGPCRAPATPGLDGPAVEFVLPDAVVQRRYKMHAVEAGQPTAFTVRLRPSTAVDGEIAGVVAIEDLRGRHAGEPRRIVLRAGTDVVVPLVASGSPVRPVFRGTTGKGTAARPFVVRGPIIEPCSAAEMAELRQHERPPRPAGSGLRVGVYFNGLGSEAIFDVLGSVKGFAPVWIYRLEPAHLAAVRVLVLPQFFDLSDMTPETARTLREWVEGGGRLILTRDAVGLRWHPRLFLEAGKGTKLSATRGVEVAVALRGFPKGTRFEHECADHVQLELGAAGKPLVSEQKTGEPVVIVGRVGKGTVILNGLCPGYDVEAEPKSDSARLMVALVNSLKP